LVLAIFSEILASSIAFPFSAATSFILLAVLTIVSDVPSTADAAVVVVFETEPVILLSASNKLFAISSDASNAYHDIFVAAVIPLFATSSEPFDAVRAKSAVPCDVSPIKASDPVANPFTPLVNAFISSEVESVIIYDMIIS